MQCFPFVNNSQGQYDLQLKQCVFQLERNELKLFLLWLLRRRAFPTQRSFGKADVFELKGNESVT